MTFFQKVFTLRHVSNVLVSKSPAIASLSRSLVVFKPQQLRLLHSSVHLNAEYKTPTNRHKKFWPTSVAVTKQNEHLEVDLTDEIGKELGKMTLREAGNLAKSKELRLIIVDESTSPVKFKLVDGKDLVKMQMKAKEEGANKEGLLKVKEIQINLGIAENDFETKTKMANSFLEKGHDVNILIKAKGGDTKVKSFIYEQNFSNFLILRCNF